jgi:hypothetical protein
VAWLAVLVGVATAQPALAAGGPDARMASYLAADRLLATHYLSVEAALLHTVPSFKLEVIEVGSLPFVLDGKTTYADADSNPTDAAGGQNGPETRCLISVVHATNVLSGSYRNAVMAHEVFHCLSAELSGTVANFAAHGQWLIEGSATWAESDLVPEDESAAGWWTKYLSKPGRPLFSRNYDAIGFFGNLAASGVSPWRVFAPMFAATSDASAYTLALAGSTTFLDTEASAFFDDQSLGAPWEPGPQGDQIADENVGRVKAHPKPVAVTKGKSLTLSVGAYADGIYKLLSATRVTEIRVAAGHARLISTDGPHLDEPRILTTLYLCDGKHKCTCPDGQKPEFHNFDEGYLAIAAGDTPASVTITGECKPLPPHTCAGLIPAADFRPQYLGPPFYAGEAVEQPDPTVAGKCDYNGREADPFCGEEGCHYATYGSVTLVNAPSEEAAKQIYDNFTVGVPGLTPLPEVGDEAAITTNGAGYMLLENDFVFVTGFSPPSNLLDAQQALSTIEGELLG